MESLLQGEVRHEDGCFPPLRVLVCEDERVVRIEELPDPRNAFIREFNSVCEEGFHARAG